MDFTTKTAMGRAIKALCEAEKKEYRTAIRYARKFNRLNRQYGRAVGKPSQLTLKNSDKMSKLINDIISMDRTDFKEVIRCAKHYRQFYFEPPGPSWLRTSNPLRSGRTDRNTLDLAQLSFHAQQSHWLRLRHSLM